MKKVKIFNDINKFEEFVNSGEYTIISHEVKVVDQSNFFPHCFAAVVFYVKNINQNG